MKTSFRRSKKTGGQTLMEYVLVLVFISILTVAVMITLHQPIKGTYGRTYAVMSSAQASH